MADSRTITINLKAVSDFNDVVSNAKQIQTALNKIKMPDSLRANFDKIFSDMEKHGTKAAEAMSNGFKTKGDISGFEKSLNGINSTYEKLIQTIAKIDKDDLGFGSYTTQIKQLETELKGLDKELEQVTAKQAEAVKKVNKPANSKSGAWDAFKEAFDARKIEEAEKALNRLQQARDRAKDKGAYDEGLVVFREALAALKHESPEAIAVIEKYEQKISELNGLKADGIKETSQAFGDVAINAPRAAEGAEKYGRSALDAAQKSQQVNSELDHFKQRITYFFGAANAVNLFKRALRSVFETVKDLDKVMTETAVVTKFDVGQMWSQLPEYTKRANELGVTIHDAYEAATLYYQQGLDTNQVMAVSNQTLKMARIAGLDAAEATDRMTNALRGFNMEINEASAEKVADVYSKLAAMSASNVDEISTAMTKVASLASNAKMDFETTSAFLAQIIETTRESAETAGTALKTVIARFSEVKKLYSEGELLGTDEEGEAIDVNKVSKALRSAGVNLNEYLAGAKGLDDVFIELASKWDNLDQVQQRYIATMAAGSRQQSRFIALMQDYKRTQELVSAAQTANGASQEQYEKTLESMETKLNRLKNAWNEFTMGVANNKLLKGAVDLLTNFIQAINKLTSSLPGALGGVTKLALAFGAFKLGRNIFSNGLAEAGKVFRGEATALGEGGAKNLVTGFQKGIKTYGKNMANIPNIFSSAQEQLDQFAESYGTRLREVLSAQSTGTTGDFARLSDVMGVFDTSGIDAAIAEAKDLNYEISQADINFIKAEQQIQAFNQGLSTMSTTMMSVGGLLMMVGRLLDNIGASKAAKTITGVGTALMLLGVAINTVKSLVKALGLETAAAGLTAQIAWGWVGVVLLAITAIIAGAIAFANSVESAGERVERLANNAKEASKAADDAAQSYEDLKNSLDDLKDKEDSLDGLITGTQAWRDAVMQVNKQVLELLQSYPKLARFVHSNNGVLELDYEGAAAVIEEYNQIAVDAQKAALYSSAVSSQANANFQRTRVSGKYAFGRVDSLEDTDANTDLLAKALVGNSDAVKALEEKLGEDNLFKNIDPNDIEAFNTYVAKLGEELGLVIPATDDAIDALRSYGQEILNVENEMSSLFPALVDAKLANKDYADSVKNFLSTDFLSDQLENEANKKYKDYTETEKKAYENYIKNRYGDSFAGLTAKGDVRIAGQKEKIKFDDLVNDFVGSRASEIVDPIVDKFVESIISKEEESAQIIEDFYKNGKGGSLTSEDLEKLGGVENLPELLKSLGLEEGSDIYKQVFSDLADGMKLSQEALEDYKNRFKELNLEYTDNLQQLSGSALKAFFNNLKDVSLESGDEAVEIIKQDFDNITKNMDSKEIKKFGEVLAATDWNDLEAVNDLSSIIGSLGIESDYAAEDIDNLRDHIINFALSTRRTSGELLSSSVKTVREILGEIQSGKADRNFTKEQYEALETVIPGIKEAFAIEGDNYIYLGNSMSELQEAIVENTEARLQETQDQLSAKVQGADYISQVLKASNLTENFDLTTLGEEAGKGFIEYFQQAMGSSVDLLGINKLTSGVNAGQLDADSINQILAALQELLVNRDSNQAGWDALQSARTPQDLYHNTEDSAERDNLVRQSVMNEAQGLGLDPAAIIELSNGIQQTNEGLRENQELADICALANAKLNTGLSEIINSYKEWTPLIDESGKLMKATTLEDAAAIDSFKKSVNKMLNTTHELSDGFFENAKNMEDLKKAAEGDVSVLKDLQKAAAYDYLISIKADENVAADEVQKLADYIMGVELPDIEIAPNMDLHDVWEGTDEFIESCNQMILASGMTRDQVAKAFMDMGYNVEFDENPQPVEEKQYYPKITYTKTDNGDGGYTLTPSAEMTEVTVSGMVPAPTIKTLTALGSGGGGVSSSNRSAGAGNRPSGGGGGGGGGGKAEKPTYWENPYDELYNLTEKINEALRTREALERRYQKIAKLGVTTAGEMRKAFKDQIAQLQYEIELQKQLQAGRLKQLQNVGNQIYTDKEGNRSTFAQLGVTRYASYNKDTGLIQIDWNAIDAVSRDPNRSEEGEAIEAYISKLEELVEGYEDVRDTIWDMEDELEDIIQQSIDDYLDFESRVYDAMVAAREKEIEAYGALSDAIQDSTSRVLNKMQEQIEDERQARENDKTEEEIADREARLAYLSRDTSGANQLEIMKLQQEIDDARQNYTDTLIDQAIQEMQKDADKAAEQREQQQALLEAQLKFDEEQGIIMAQVEEILRNSFSDDQAVAMSDEELKNLLQDNEAFKNMSSIGKEEWLRGFIESWNKAQSGYKADEEKRKAEEAAAAAAQSTTPSTPTTTTPKQPAASTPKYPLPLSDDTAKGIATSICFVSGGGGWGNWPDRENRLVAKFGSGAYWKVQQYVEQIVAAGWSNLWGKDGRKYTYASFKTGGLADFTGPAWLDGSRSHPEMVLNAADTENLIMLKDILNSILKRTSNAFGTAASELNFDIDINADLSSDYDVEQLADKVKGIIYDEAMYKNVNTVNRLR